MEEQQYVELLEQLEEQRDEALSHSRWLQAKLAQLIKGNARNFGRLDGDVSSAQQLYEQNLEVLRDLKEQLVTEEQRGEQLTEELAARCQEKRREVRRRWRREEEQMCLKLSLVLLRWMLNGEPSWTRRRQRCRSSAAASGAGPPGPRWTPSWRWSRSTRRSW